MKTSHSESALTSPGALTGGGASPLKSPSTPIHIIKKDLVLSPLSKIAKVSSRCYFIMNNNVGLGVGPYCLS